MDAGFDSPFRWNRRSSPVSDGPVGTLTGEIPDGAGNGGAGSFSMHVSLAAIKPPTADRRRRQEGWARQPRLQEPFDEVRALGG